jgi:hypothetical protein
MASEISHAQEDYYGMFSVNVESKNVDFTEVENRMNVT